MENRNRESGKGEKKKIKKNNARKGEMKEGRN